MNALVLSGGGANGAFQVGAIAALRDRGVDFDVVAGVSVGSLNGALVAQDEIDTLIKIWMEVKDEDVYLKKNILQILWRILVQRKKSVYDAEPLWNMIRKHISLRRMVKKYYMGFTSLVDGEYHCYGRKDFIREEEFQKAIYASSLMPILWEPVQKIATRFGTLLECVDGGLRDVTPLGAVLKEQPDHIYIISCSTGNPTKEIPTNILDVIKRTFLDVMLSEVVRNDVEGMLRINELVLQAEAGGVSLRSPKGKIYKHFKVTHIQPPHPLGSPIDFSHEKNMRNFQLGVKEVANVYIL
jgi:NTE family protein